MKAAPADVKISIGSAPVRLTGHDSIHLRNMSISPNEYLLHVPGVADYYAAFGNTIVIDPAPGADMNSVRLFMFSNAMAAIIHQQKKIPFHASGVVTDKGLVLFTGNSGAGKSTTAYALMQSGYPLFTDDVCVLSINAATNKIEATASYPMMKLWEDTAEKLPAPFFSKSHQLRPQVSKYGIFQHDNFITAPLPVQKVFFLKTSGYVDSYQCSEVDKLTSFNILQQNTYRRSQVIYMQLQRLHFTIISKMATQVKVAELSRSPGTSDIPGFISFVKMYL